jgi:hypothetical protein
MSGVWKQFLALLSKNWLHLLETVNSVRNWNGNQGCGSGSFAFLF